MMTADQQIQNANKTICDNIDMLEFSDVTRALISQNLLAQSRNLVEGVVVKIYAQDNNIEVSWETIKASQEFIKHDNKYLFLREFHGFLQESSSHYTPEQGGAERLMLKYHQYFMMIRNFMKTEYGMEILWNLEKFPVNIDHSVQEYHEKIAERLNTTKWMLRDFSREQRLYVHKVVPFIVAEKIYYEIILTPAYDTISKFDRFVCYSKMMIPSHYSIKADIQYDDIRVNGKRMPLYILNDFEVSIRPCEINNFASLFGKKISISPSHAEYNGMMKYLTKSGESLLDIAVAPQREYENIKRIMFEKSKVHHFEPVLDESRKMIFEKAAGSNIVRYLLHTLNNKIIKTQRGKNEENPKLSGLYLAWGCIPFEEMPFATSLIEHNPSTRDLFQSIPADGRDHELLARYIQANMSSNSRLYTPEKELTDYNSNADKVIERFNNKLYYKHNGRKIKKFGQSYYESAAYTNTKIIMDALIQSSNQSVQGYSSAITAWMDKENNVDSPEKYQILQHMYEKSRVALIYGAAGTGKTYLINHVAQFWDDRTKLFLANTNPAVENLKRKVVSQNCEFMTIARYLRSRRVSTEYDILVMDECSMVSNADMAKVLGKVKYKLLLLVGDTYQIESIMFGNWFSLAKYFVPRCAWNELENPFRTQDKDLLTLWEKVRNLSPDMTEHIVANEYASNLDISVFERRSDDEIILCLNYDGLYGINNINRFLQENNPNEAYRWGLWTFKVGDPILFNENERFAPVLYNNLKGKIVGIERSREDEIWFSIEIEKPLTELDVMDSQLILEESENNGRSVVRFRVTQKSEKDEDNDFADDTDIPFQIAYAVSIHKAQGLEYDSVKVIITQEVDEMITHNIFYTAITRSRKYLKIYWSPETQQKVLSGFEITNAKKDASIFHAQSGLKMYKG